MFWAVLLAIMACMSQKWTQGKNNENATWPRGLTLVGTFGQNGVTRVYLNEVKTKSDKADATVVFARG